jgi:hypothetical protein
VIQKDFFAANSPFARLTTELFFMSERGPNMFSTAAKALP